jgi:hypothetical protein
MHTLKTHNYTTYARKAIEFFFYSFCFFLIIIIIISRFRVFGLIIYLDEIPII